jgi:hypothetical protein
MFKPEIIKTPMTESENLEARIVENIEITEDKIFSREEILSLIEQIAKQENIQPNELIISEEAQDPDGNTIVICVQVAETRARAQGWESIEYMYQIKGNLGQEGVGNVSVVSRIYNLIDPQSMQAGQIAIYEDEEWIMDPDKISPKHKLK